MRRFWAWLLVALTLASATAAPAQIVGGVPLPLLQGPNGCNQSATLELDFNTNLFCSNGQKFGSAAAAISGWSYSRTGTEDAQTSSGLLVPFASGVPAVTDLGLQVWEARTNLALWSQDFSNAVWNTFAGAAKVGASPVAAPDGSLTAYELSFGATGGAIASASAVYQTSITVVNTSTYSTAFYIRAKSGTTTVRVSLDTGGSVTGSADTTVTSTAWTRIPVTAAAGATTATIAVRNNVAGNSANVYVWQGDLQLGAFIGPPILTTTVSATRGAASASVGGLSLPSAYTIYAEGSVAALGSDRILASADDGTTNNRAILFARGSDGLIMMQVDAGGVNQFYNGVGTAVAGSTFKVAARVQGGSFAVTSGGATPVTGAGTLPVATKLGVGVMSSGNSPADGVVRRVVVYPTAFTNAQLQALTQ